MHTADINQTTKIHEGRNVKRFREMLGKKQDALAFELGTDWSQKKVSQMEAKETIGAKVLAEIAKALNVPEEAIRNFDEAKAISNLHTSYEVVNQEPDPSHHHYPYTSCSFNLVDKLVETLEDIKLLYIENKNLYERLLQSEKERQQTSK